MLKQLIDPEFFEAFASGEADESRPMPVYGTRDPLLGLCLSEVEERSGPAHHRLLR